ncbi:MULTISPECIES: NAD-dependent epimerase/dehydratase family protein [Nocardioides]|uniref:NAD-dependent epimerase/dehydratase family protein n=1 Tax=Nocardioides vastitatis TaxID=2568655 RepID=A0ABW0ZJT2_9ACTN|nr:NAD-dependent epimerase/dehydratase family protein [Nocardioides sp.]THJ04152.1 NAD-dependent epimerase/dehydratase family protein [Nocardioides sp.]
MRLLVLGGTVFLSREIAAQALRRGHEVVCACRGESGGVPEGATLLRWDRGQSAPDELTTGSFDAVVDVSRVPSHVRRGLDAVSDAHWVFVSTISVYADDADPGGPGVGVLHEPSADDVDLRVSPAAYGPMKVACEELVLSRAASATVVRPGLIVGPGDPSGRFTYWADRFTRDGEVLAPGDPAAVVQVIDVRDLAAWIVTLAEDRRVGVLDGVGQPMSFADLLRACAPSASLTWVDQEFLGDHGVEPWTGPDSLPVWLPRPAYDGMLAHSPQPALDAGLVLRPVGETCRDTQAWLRADPAARITGITAEREQELIGAWGRRGGVS